MLSLIEMPNVNTILASTTVWSEPLFTETHKFIYITIGVTVAVAVAMLLLRSISWLVRRVSGEPPHDEDWYNDHPHR